MWFKVCLGLLLVFGTWNCGVCDDIEWFTTLSPEDTDSQNAEETDIISWDLEDSNFDETDTEEPEIVEFLSKYPGIFHIPQWYKTKRGLVHASEEDMALIQPYVPYPKGMYPYFRSALKNVAKSEERTKMFFNFLNRPSPRRAFLDGIFYNRIRKFYTGWPVEDSDSVDEITDGGVDHTSTDGTLDHGVYRSSTDGTTEDVYHASTDGNTDDGSYSIVETDHESVGLDSSSWDSVGRSGVVFNEKVSTEATPVQDCDSQCKSPLQAGSIRGIPGEHFPDYSEIPITSFSCADKKLIPGFYADLETACQVFHVCWPHRRESFLCPIGTTFNQPLLACDYWYSNNCSLAPLFFDTHAFPSEEDTSTMGATESTIYSVTASQTAKESPKVTKPIDTKIPSTQSPVAHRPSTTDTLSPTDKTLLSNEDFLRISKFLPVKSKIIVYPESKDATIKPKSVSQWALNKEASVDHEDKARKLLVASQVLRDVIGMAENVARDTQRYIDTMKLDAKRLEPKLMKNKPTAKLPEPNAKVSQTSTETNKAAVEKSLPTLNPRFIVKPSGPKDQTTTIKQQSTDVNPPTSTEQYQTTKVKPMKDENLPEKLMRLFEVFGTALQKDILTLTKKVMIQNLSKVADTKKQ